MGWTSTAVAWRGYKSLPGKLFLSTELAQDFDEVEECFEDYFTSKLQEIHPEWKLVITEDNDETETNYYIIVKPLFCVIAYNGSVAYMPVFSLDLNYQEDLNNIYKHLGLNPQSRITNRITSYFR